jgi:hypothetical protein
MVKKIFIATYIILATSLTVHGADKWTGPTSSLDPMYGLKGSSVMAEILRGNTVQTYMPPQINRTPLSDLQTPLERGRSLEDAYQQGKADGQRR